MSQKEYFEGTFVDIWEVDRCLSLEEIEHLCNGGIMLFDRSGNGHHGMAINMTSANIV